MTQGEESKRAEAIALSLSLRVDIFSVGSYIECHVTATTSENSMHVWHKRAKVQKK